MPHFAILKALVFVAAMVAASACSLDNAIAQHEPCWTKDDAFTYEPMILEGVIQVDTTPNLEHLFLIEPNGRLADLGWPDGFTESFGPGRSGRAQSQFGLVVAQSGQRVVLWGALIRVATSKRAPASPGHDGFVVCEIDGQRFTPPPDPRVDGSNVPNHVTLGSPTEVGFAGRRRVEPNGTIGLGRTGRSLARDRVGLEPGCPPATRRRVPDQAGWVERRARPSSWAPRAA